jgi:hypothetical protein
MTLAEFVRDVLAGSIAVMVGGRGPEDEMLSGTGNPSNLTNEQIAAEAFARDVEDVSGDNFDSTVAEVARLRKISDGG